MVLKDAESVQLQDIRANARAGLECVRRQPERYCESMLTVFAHGTWFHRLVFSSARRLPEAFFTATAKRAAAWPQHRQPKALSQPFLKLFRWLFLCRGYWDSTAQTEAMYRQLRRRVPILAFSCGDEGAWEERLEGHLQLLRRGGYRSVSLEELRAWQERLAPLPARPVVLTFDTDEAQYRARVQPLLERYAFSGVCFAPAGNEGEFPSGLRAACGRFAAYPQGPVRLRWMTTLQERGFLGACVMESGANDCRTHAYFLRRMPVQPHTGRGELRRMLQGKAGRAAARTWRQYWEGRTSDEHRGSDDVFYRDLAAEVRLLLGERHAGERVLEFACGTGRLTEELGFDPARYRGVDISPAMLEAFFRRRPEYDLVVAEASSYVEPERQYDLIFSYSLIQQLDRGMLDRHFAAVRSMMHAQSRFVCAHVAWRRQRLNWYGGLLWHNRIGAKPLLKSFLDRYLLGRGMMGHWYEPRDLARIAARHGMVMRLYGSLHYPHTFHAAFHLSGAND